MGSSKGSSAGLHSLGAGEDNWAPQVLIGLVPVEVAVAGRSGMRRFPWEWVQVQGSLGLIQQVPTNRAPSRPVQPPSEWTPAPQRPLTPHALPSFYA